jgi:hypothetical protein
MKYKSRCVMTISLQKFTMLSDSAQRTMVDGRFSQYSQRVRTLVCSDEQTQLGHKLVVSNIVILAWLREQSTLFPNLCNLEYGWYNAPVPSRAQLLVLWIRPSTTKIQFTLSFRTASRLAEIDMQHINAAASQCSGLVEFRCEAFARSGDGSLPSGGWARVLCELLCGSTKLRRVSGLSYVTATALIHLASCPHLRSFSAGSLVQSDDIPVIPQNGFAHLEKAHIYDHGDVHARLMHAFLRPSMDNLRKLTLRGEQIVSVEEWTLILHELGTHTSIIDLTIAMTMTNEINTQTSAVIFLQPLTSLVCLERLTIHTSLGPHISELDQLCLMMHWPRLRHLEVSGTVSQRLSLHTFMQMLIQCPHLESLANTVICSSLDLPPPDVMAHVKEIRHPFIGPLKLIVSGDSDVQQLAQELGQAMPHLRELIDDFGTEEEITIDDQEYQENRFRELTVLLGL